MMNYEIFKEVVKEKFMDYMPEKFKGMELVAEPVEKVNVTLDGIILREEGRNISPTIYINDMYKKYQDCGDLEETLMAACDFMERAYEQAPVVDVDSIMRDANEKIVFQLINTEQNKTFLEQVPHREFQDLSIVYAILRRMPAFKGHAASLEKFMIMDAVKAWDGWAKWNFENRVAECEKMTKGVYPQNVIEKILNYQEYESIRDMLLNHLHERRYNKQLTYSNYYVMNKLRVMFARISVSMLEPDLVIMDEFQRFKFLLSSDDSELGILAHSFLSGHDTRVLLLSATPYKLYSTLEEIDENQLDEHYAEFFQVMNFLFDDEVKDIKFMEVWKNYSHALSELKAGDSAIIRMKELAENAMYQGVQRIREIRDLLLILIS